MRLLAVVLKKKYNKESLVYIPRHRYIIKEKKDGSIRVQKNTEVPTRRRNSLLPKNGTTKKKVSEFL